MNAPTALLAAIALVQSCQPQFSSPTNLASTMTHSPASSSTEAMAPLKSLGLIARQETELPDGEVDAPNRPTGFAAVFLTIKNASDRPQALEQLKVEVVAVDSGETQLSSEPQTFQLQPLENAVQDIQLNRREGYGTTGKVKAIATYRINDQVHRLESAAVEIR